MDGMLALPVALGTGIVYLVLRQRGTSRAATDGDR